MSEVPTMTRTEHSPQTNLQGAHGVIFHVETLGKGVAAILIGGVILAVLLSGMALMRTETASRDARLAEREAKLAREDIVIIRAKLAERGINTDEHD